MVRFFWFFLMRTPLNGAHLSVWISLIPKVEHGWRFYDHFVGSVHMYCTCRTTVTHTTNQPTPTHTQSRGISAGEAWWVTRYVGPEPVALYSEASCPPTYTLDSQACLQAIVVSQTHTVAQVHLWDSAHNSKQTPIHNHHSMCCCPEKMRIHKSENDHLMKTCVEW